VRGEEFDPAPTPLSARLAEEPALLAGARPHALLEALPRRL
jgi:hypothetical protein